MQNLLTHKWNLEHQKNEDHGRKGVINWGLEREREDREMHV